MSIAACHFVADGSESIARYLALFVCPEGCIDEAYHNLGLILRAQGRLREAADCFRRAIELDPEYDNAKEALDDVTRPAQLLGDGAS